MIPGLHHLKRLRFALGTLVLIDGGAFFLIYKDTIPLAGVGPGQVGDGGTSWSCDENGLTSLELAGRRCFSLFYSDGCWGLHILPLTTLAC